MTPAPWTLIDADAAVLWREYFFSRGALATTMVFRGTDGLVVVSPAAGLEAQEYDALAEYGEVKALVANNTHHHLGQAAWRARFPAAVSYAPERVIPVLRSKCPDIPFVPLSELPLPPGAFAAVPPGYKAGEAFFSVPTARGAVWFTGDLLTNIQRVPRPPLRWLFTWTGSAPGFRLFRPGVWLFVADKAPLRAWMLERLASDPPAVVVPAHGPPVDDADLAALVRAQLERL